MKTRGQHRTRALEGRRQGRVTRWVTGGSGVAPVSHSWCGLPAPTERAETEDQKCRRWRGRGAQGFLFRGSAGRGQGQAQGSGPQGFAPVLRIPPAPRQPGEPKLPDSFLAVSSALHPQALPAAASGQWVGRRRSGCAAKVGAGQAPEEGPRLPVQTRPPGSGPSIWADVTQPHGTGCGGQRWDEGRRMDRQTHTQRKEKEASGPGEGHLSLSPGRRSPDLQARSTSFSKSVCKTEAGRGEAPGLAGAAPRGFACAHALARPERQEGYKLTAGGAPGSENPRRAAPPLRTLCACARACVRAPARAFVNELGRPVPLQLNRAPVRPPPPRPCLPRPPAPGTPAQRPLCQGLMSLPGGRARKGCHARAPGAAAC